MRTTATFRLFGSDQLTASDVTARLRIAPTTVHEADATVNRLNINTGGHSSWRLTSSATVEDGVELSTQLNRLLEILEPAADALWELDAAGYQANWFCYVESHAAEQPVELDRTTIQRLLALPGDLWLDIGADEID